MLSKIIKLKGAISNPNYKKTLVLIFISVKKYTLYKPINKNLTILAIITLYNEKDIILQNIKYLINQGIHVRIIDNWSTDGSYKKIKLLEKKKVGLSVERFPKYKPTKYYQWKKLLKRVETISKKYKYDWYIHYDSNEFRESPWLGISLLNEIKFVDSLGFNALDFTVLNYRFRKSTCKFSSKYEPLNYFKYCEFGSHTGHFI